ncbi:MAG: MATE family efflux transporter [Firmicutes bacterium]|nr:MATE family efflux transporter [Bacillota bacterium]
MLCGLFSVEKMLPQSQRIGDIPASKDAYRDVMRIALPSVMEMVLVSLVGSVDTMMVGGLGPEALAAVGLTGQPRMLVLSIFFALNIGVTAVIARRKGEGRQDKANEALRNALVIIVLLSIVVMAICLPLAKPLMRLAGAQDDTIELARTYFLIVNAILPLNGLMLCVNAAQRGVGNTRIALYVNIVSNAVNIMLNWLLINGNLGFPRLGVAGAAIATVIGFVMGFFLSVYSILSKGSVGRFLHVNLRHSDWRLKKDSLSAIVKVGGNAVFEQIALRIGFFAYARLVADLGTMAFAAHQICVQFLNISFNFGDGIGVAGTSLVGQMLGKNRPDLAMIYGKISQRMAMLAALFLASVIVLLRHPFISLFTDDAVVLAMATQLMFMVAAFQPLQMSSVVISGALRGAGDTRFVAAVMLLCVTVIRPTLAFASIHFLGLGLMGAWGASIIDMSVRLVCVYRRFHGGKWVEIKV